MRLRGETVGAIYLDNRFQPDAFHESALGGLCLFADQSALALEAAELRAEQARRRDAQRVLGEIADVDVDRYEMTAWVPLIILIVVIGFYPKLVFGATTDAVVSAWAGGAPAPAAAAPPPAEVDLRRGVCVARKHPSPPQRGVEVGRELEDGVALGHQPKASAATPR